jgi:hypothetical protein
MSANPAAAVDFLVRKDDMKSARFAAAPAPSASALRDGEVLMRVDKFAFTANNVTYAAFGDAMHYWHFFPAPEGWGRIPVWGFGDVIASKSGAAKVGERFYGYFPMSSHLVVTPERASAMGFFDGAEHRKALHPVYNQYVRTTTDPGYDAKREAEQMLLRPLFTTSFLIDDFLADNGFFDARSVILSSASSKTAYGTAFLLHRRKSVEVIGLTSSANAAFVERLGCYDRAVAYDAIGSLAADTPTVYVDMAGSAAVRAAVHRHFGDALKYSCAVGGTHWEALGGGRDLPGPKPMLFFAPAQIKKRNADWGAATLQRKIGEAWLAFLGPVGGWMRVVESRGPEAVERVYRDMLDGRAKPDEGHILSLGT